MICTADQPYKLFHKHHRDLRRTLWNQIERRNPRLCWRWMGDHDADGIPEFTFAHEGEIYTIAVPRYIYYAVYDEMPPVVEHVCDNPWCCNVNHLVAEKLVALQI